MALLSHMYEHSTAMQVSKRPSRRRTPIRKSKKPMITTNFLKKIGIEKSIIFVIEKPGRPNAHVDGQANATENGWRPLLIPGHILGHLEDTRKVWAKCGGKVQRDLRGNGEFSGKLAMIN
jgi:hypothetical protein